MDVSQRQTTKPKVVTPRLVYFNLSGLGEPVRFMLAYCRENFIDERLTWDQFIACKDQFPYGKLPYLEIDGLCLHQSMTICRYLAQKHGLTGNDAKDAILADVMASTVDDIRAGLVKYFFEKDEKLKEKKKEESLKHTEYYLDRLEKAVKYNGGYLVQGKLTWADVVFASFSTFLSHMAGTDLFANRPQLKQLQNKIFENEEIKNYIQNKPEHIF